VLVGEQAVLKEYESQKRKAERLKLSKFAFGSYTGLQGSFTPDTDPYSQTNLASSSQPRQNGSGSGSKSSRGRQNMVGKNSSSNLAVNFL